MGDGLLNDKTSYSADLSVTAGAGVTNLGSQVYTFGKVACVYVIFDITSNRSKYDKLYTLPFTCKTYIQGIVLMDGNNSEPTSYCVYTDGNGIKASQAIPAGKYSCGFVIMIA